MIKTKFLFAVVLVSCLMLLFKIPPTWAQDADEPKTLFGEYLKSHDITVSGSATLDFYDKYVWRGQYLDRDSVLQPGVSLSAKGFTVGYWGSFDMENMDALSSDESDYYVSYTLALEKGISLTGGHTWYDFPEGNTSSKEFFVTLAAATLLNPSFTFYHDYEDGKDLNTVGRGNYYALNLSHSVPLFKEHGVSLELAASAGYVDGQWLSGKGWHITPSVGIKLPITANFSITPTVGYNAPFQDLKNPNIGNQQEKIFGGVKSAFTF